MWIRLNIIQFVFSRVTDYKSLFLYVTRIIYKVLDNERVVTCRYLKIIQKSLYAFKIKFVMYYFILSVM